MENFVTDFRGEIERYADALNIIDNEINRAQMGRYGYGHVNISEEREKIIEEMDNAANLAKRTTEAHVTSVRFNRTEESEMVLGLGTHVCLKIKEMTILLGYAWDYPEFC